MLMRCKAFSPDNYRRDYPTCPFHGSAIGVKQAILLGFLYLAIPNEVQAQWQSEDAVGDENDKIITPSRSLDSAFGSPRTVDALNRKKIMQFFPATTTNALEYAPTIYWTRNSLTGLSPIIRGLTGQHLLLLIDGVRLNNTLTASFPSDALSGIDIFQVQGIEVMNGPGSPLYGSDAMGAVIYLQSLEPPLLPRRAWNAAAEAWGRFNSADTSLLGSFDFSGQIRDLGLRLGITYKHFGEIHGGHDIGHQLDTGYQEKDVYVSAAWALRADSRLRLTYWRVHHDDLSTPMTFSSINSPIHSNREQDFAALTYVMHSDSGWVRQIQATLSYQGKHETSQQDLPDPNSISRLQDRLHTLGAALSFQSILPHNQLSYGLDFYNDWVSSNAAMESSNPPNDTPHNGRYLDGSKHLQTGFYVHDQLSINQSVAISLATRLDFQKLDIPFASWPYSNEINATQTNFSGSLHGRYLLGNGLNLVVGISQGFHAPNVADYSALSCNPQLSDLSPSKLEIERNLTAEAGAKLDLYGLFRASLFYYFTYLTNMIIRAPFSSDSSLLEPCVVLSINDSFPTYPLYNESAGRIHGVEGALQASLGSQWDFFAWISWAHADSDLHSATPVITPLSYIPPLNGSAGIRFHDADERKFIELAMKWALSKDQPHQWMDQMSTFCPPNQLSCQGTSGYAVPTLRGGMMVGKVLRFTLTIDNILHQAYRTFGSHWYEPGFSALIGVEALIASN